MAQFRNQVWNQWASDTRAVGERSPVSCQVSPQYRISGWAEIVRECIADDSDNGPMVLRGPVYSHPTGTHVLDDAPRFRIRTQVGRWRGREIVRAK